MGLLVKGKWSDQWYDTKSHNGEFVRQESRFRNWVMDRQELAVKAVFLPNRVVTTYTYHWPVPGPIVH